MRYLNLAYPAKPADWDSYMAAMRAKLTEPGRMAEFMKTFKSTGADAAEQLPNVHCAALIIMGTADPDFADPRPRARATRSPPPCPPGSPPSPPSTAPATTRRPRPPPRSPPLSPRS